MKKVLFVTYFWPPSGKASAHWPLSMTRHLPGLGWKSAVLTIDKDTFSQVDLSLEQAVDPSVNVLRARSIEPFDLYRRFLGRDRSSPLVASEAISRDTRGLRHRIAIWIRMNLFVPDARIGWYWTAIKAGRKFLSTTRVDAIVSVGPPHTALLVGKALAKQFSIPHVPVLIDPWVDIVYYRGFRRNPLTLAIDRALERSVMQSADSIAFVTETMKDDYARKYPFLRNKAFVLPWGYDEEPFRGLAKPKRKTRAEVLLHAGNLFDYQDPQKLWTTVRRLVKAGRNIRIVFIGTVSPGVRASIEKNDLDERTEYRGFLPYREMLEELMNASYVFLCATEPRHVPGKLFEYLRSGKPILAFGDDNEEVGRILQKAGSGALFPFSSGAEEFFRRAKRFHIRKRTLQQFERAAIAEKLAELLSKISG